MSELARIEIEQRDGVVIAHVKGELDLSNAPGCGQQILERVSNDVRGVAVDFSELGFLDSSGVSMLFGLARGLSSHRQRLAVAAAPGAPVSRVLEMVDFSRVAELHGTVEEAVAAVLARKDPAR